MERAGPLASAVALLAVMSATGPAAGVVIISATALYGVALASLAAKGQLPAPPSTRLR